MLKQYVIAIGGPLRSLNPLLTFFDHTPLNNASYIILQHLPKGYRSVLDEILHRHSKLKVVEATNGAPVENDKVYFAPPWDYLTLSDGRLRFVKREPGPNRAFDVFLESLARNENNRKAIAVIFSGFGTDGVKGVAAVKKAGGLVIVQTPESCDHPQLPQRIIEDGYSDYSLLPADMPVVIQGYINRSVPSEV